jgi:hypothetical protein
MNTLGWPARDRKATSRVHRGGVLLLFAGLAVMACSLTSLIPAKPDLYFGVYSGDGPGIMSCSGDWILEPMDRDSGVILGPMADGLARYLDRSGDWETYINKDGKFPFDAKFDQTMPFSDGLAAVRVDDEWGYIDATGDFAIEPQYPGLIASPFRDGLAPIAVEVSPAGIPKSWAYINKKGEQVLGPYLSAGPFSDGLAAVVGTEDEERVAGFIKPSGEFVLKFSMEDKLGPGGLHSDGLFPVRDVQMQIDEGKCAIGFMNKDAEWVIEPQFCNVGAFADGLAPASVLGDGKEIWGYINKSGEMVIDAKYDLADPFSGGCARVAWENYRGWGLIDTKGKMIYEYEPD